MKLLKLTGLRMSRRGDCASFCHACWVRCRIDRDGSVLFGQGWNEQTGTDRFVAHERLGKYASCRCCWLERTLIKRGDSSRRCTYFPGRGFHNNGTDASAENFHLLIEFCVKYSAAISRPFLYIALREQPLILNWTGLRQFLLIFDTVAGGPPLY